MTYNQAVKYLFDSAPMFQNVGAAAYKEGLGGTLLLDEHFGHPHRNYKTIHVGGTNGKGSVTHTLAAILQAQGYRVGLYTSPHLVDFRERIRVNGKMISKKRVTDFVRELKIENGKLKGNSIFNLQSSIDFSFFELATALAFKYFEEQKVDFAVIEVGLGGRLDCTNIITPVLSVITNISFDHVQFLGDTLPKIASEKAGIIKPGIPVCIGENINEEVKAVFQNKANEVGAPITFAEDENCKLSTVNGLCSTFNFQLKGLCQEKNQRTILTSVRLLRESGIEISDKAIKKGFAEVCTMTGLMGRWQVLSKRPLTICDTGHNVGGMQYIANQLTEMRNEKLSKDGKAKLHIVFGCCHDKDVSTVLKMLPKDAIFYFTQASVERAMNAERLSEIALSIFNIQSSIYNDVGSACKAAQAAAGENDIIFIGGSTFVVADLLRNMKI
jgi:dihydrofolate synthase/folylpolyglutamate synthase